jgi:hypothetical protein
MAAPDRRVSDLPHLRDSQESCDDGRVARTPTYGDTVIVKAEAPAKYRPGSRASVFALGTPGRDLVGIEFLDGSSVEIPPDLIELE